MIGNSDKSHSTIWTKVKFYLKKNGIKGKDKFFLKEKIGFRIIEDNKSLIKEIQTWTELYNQYLPKMSLYYQHSKEYLPLFHSILDKANHIQNRLQIDKKVFIDVLGDFIYEHIDNFDYKEILRILTYDIVFNEEKFDKAVVVPFYLDLELDKKYNNAEYIRQIIEKENLYLNKQVDALRELMGVMTDICEFKEFLNKETLNSLDNYLDTNYEYISSNLTTYYKNNKINYIDQY